MAEQLDLFRYGKRINDWVTAIHDTLVAYAGQQQKFTKQSRLPRLVFWPTYELFKLGMTPEQVSKILRSKYPTDFENPAVDSLLSLVLRGAQEEYLNSGHVIRERLPNSARGKNKN